MIKYTKELFKTNKNNETFLKLVGSKNLLEHNDKSLEEVKLKLYPPVLNTFSYDYADTTFGESAKSTLTGLDVSLNKLFEFFQTESYLKKLFKEDSLRLKLLNNRFSENIEFLPILNLLNLSDFSILYDPSNTFFNVSEYNATKKIEGIHKHVNLFTTIKPALIEVPEYVWYFYYTKFLSNNLKSFLTGFPNLINIRQVLTFSSKIIPLVISHIPDSPVPIIPDTFHSFAFASTLIVLSHPFVLVDLGDNSRYSVIFQMTHSNLDSLLFKKISSLDIMGGNFDQYINGIPFLVEKSVIAEILKISSFSRYNSQYTLYLAENRSILSSKTTNLLINPKTVFVDITNTSFLVLDMLKQYRK